MRGLRLGSVIAALAGCIFTSGLVVGAQAPQAMGPLSVQSAKSAEKASAPENTQLAASKPNPANGDAVGHALTGPDLEAFFDGVVPMQLERSDVAGASVLVMKDGQVLLQKGYGVADEKTKKPSIRLRPSFAWRRFPSSSPGSRSCS